MILDKRLMALDDFWGLVNVVGAVCKNNQHEKSYHHELVFGVKFSFEFSQPPFDADLSIYTLEDVRLELSYFPIQVNVLDSLLNLVNGLQEILLYFLLYF